MGGQLDILMRRLACAARSPLERARIVVGTRQDLSRLAGAHYRAGPPRAVDLVLRAELDGAAIGVLAVTRPVLNAWWRRAALGDRFDHLPPRERAHAINDQIRCIARVIVAPEWRALGVGSLLIRTYLAAPRTPCTEAVAAMSAVCPLFTRAGMRQILAPPSRTNADLLAAAARCAVPRRRLLDPALCASSLRASPALFGAARRWAGRSSATRRLIPPDPTPESLAVLLSARLAMPRLAFWHEAGLAPPRSPPLE